MATIKTTNETLERVRFFRKPLGSPRIITKTLNGKVRVSFACCPPEYVCCMYPARDLVVNFTNPFLTRFTSSDLPDAVTLNWTGRFNGTLNKDGSGYSNGGDITLTVIGTKWALTDSEDPENIVICTVGNCLFAGGGNLTPGDDRVEDQFPSSLGTSFTYEGSDYGGQPLIREDLCDWMWKGPLFYDEGIEEPYGAAFHVYYFNYSHTLAPFKWFVQYSDVIGNGPTYIKTGNQNGPIGTYNKIPEGRPGRPSSYPASISIFE